MGWARYPNWVGDIHPFSDRPEITWPVLWQECKPEARPLPFPTVFVDRFWEAKEHWLPDGVGTDPDHMFILRGQDSHPHYGKPVGTEREFLEGLSYETWLAGGYADRPDEHCNIDVTLQFRLKLGVKLNSAEIIGPYVRDDVRSAARLNVSEVSNLHLSFSLRLGIQLHSTENSLRMVTDSIRAAARLSGVETSSAHVMDQIRAAARLEALEVSGLLELATIRAAARLSGVETSSAHVADQIRAAARLHVSESSSRHFADTIRAAARVNGVNSNHYSVADAIRAAARLNATETFTPGDQMTVTEYTFNFTDFQTAGTSKDVTVYSLPAGDFLAFVVVRTTTAFVGAGLFTVTLTVKFGSASLSPTYSVLGSTPGGETVASGNTADSGFPSATVLGVGSFSGATDIKINATSFGANLSVLSAGQVKIWVATVDL